MDKDLLERARWFSWRRQRLDRSCRGVEDCLISVVGVYSANPFGPLSLLARVPRLLKGAAVEGVIGTKRAVRIPAMRRSVFMVPTETAPAIFWATRAQTSSALRRAGIDEDEYKSLRREVLLAAGLPKTAEQIHEALSDPPDDLMALLHAMCDDGSLLRIKSSSIRTNALTYAATKVWLGAELEKVPQERALAWLAGEYLTAFGPATPKDFAWWAGVSSTKAAAALEAQDPAQLDDGLLMHRRDVRALDGTRPHLGRVNLLPKLDCYTMGYAPEGRARFADPDVLPLLYESGGDSRPVVLVEGEVAGTWGFRFGRTRITITLSMFDVPGPRLRAALESEVELVGSFLEASKTTLELIKVPRPTRSPSARKTPVKKRPVRRSGKRPARAAARTKKRVPAKRPAARATPRRRSPSGSTPRRTRPSPKRRNRRP
ncbi:MAG: DNA glycosylase AlkZ-like family protein [Actinomycetota bacterium]